MAVILKPSTLLRFYHALVKRKYYLLYNSRKRHRPGPKGPSKEAIDAVVEMKRRNPRFGCRKVAEQLSSAFGIEINKDAGRHNTHPVLQTGTRRSAISLSCACSIARYIPPRRWPQMLGA